MKLGRWIRWGFILALGFSAAWVAAHPWNVTPQVQGSFRSFSKESGWQFQARDARWIPCMGLELKDLELVTPHGGRLYVERVQARPETLGGRLQLARFILVPRTFWMFRGSMKTRWELGPIRIDPASWRIRQPLAQELLSAGPVATGGILRLTLRGNEWTLEKTTLGGPLLRLEAQGWLKQQQQVYLLLRGDVTRAVLEGMRVLKPAADAGAGSWEPFQLLVEGVLRRPQIRFTSGFFSFAINQSSEGKP